MSGGLGNFSPLGLMDLIHGTSLGGDVMKDVGGEMEENEVGGLTGRVVEKIGKEAKSKKEGRKKARKSREDEE